jgi:hypothetical protein
VKTLTRRIAVVAATVAIIGSGLIGTTVTANAARSCTRGYSPCIPKPSFRRGLLRRQRERSSIHPSRRRVSRLG